MFSIGQLSKRTGVKVPTIRYYEEMGLIENAGRTAGNQRRYSQAGLDRLHFIRHCRDLGLHLDDIRTLIQLEGKGGDVCPESHAIAERHLADIRHRIARLQALEAELDRIRHACSGHPSGSCEILTAFGDHSHCDSEHGERV